MNLYYDSTDEDVKEKLILHLKNIFAEVNQYYNCLTNQYRWVRVLALRIMYNGQTLGKRNAIPFLKSEYKKKKRDPTQVINMNKDLLETEIDSIAALCKPELGYYITLLKHHLLRVGLTGDE